MKILLATVAITILLLSIIFLQAPQEDDNEDEQPGLDMHP